MPSNVFSHTNSELRILGIFSELDILYNVSLSGLGLL